MDKSTVPGLVVAFAACIVAFCGMGVDAVPNAEGTYSWFDGR